MFANFKRIADGVQALTAELRGIREALDARPVDDALKGRVQALEADVAKRIAEAEALVLQAESKFKQARAAEERERHNAKRAEEAREELESLREESLDPFEAAGQAWQLHQGDAEGGGSEGVSPVRNGVEIPPSPEQVAARLKFGGV